MDRVYRRQRHIYDLTRKYYLLGRDRLIAGLDRRPAARVLEIGCGTGRNLVAGARPIPRRGCSGSTSRPRCWRRRAASLARAGLAPRIALAQGDATAFDPRGSVRPRSLRPRLHLLRALDDPAAGATRSRRRLQSLAPGGCCTSSISAIAAARPARSEPDCANGSPPSRSSRATISAMCSGALAAERGMTCTIETRFRGYAVRGCAAKRLTPAGFTRRTPARG